MLFMPRLFAASADGNMNFRASTNAADVTQINAGDERYETAESVVFSG
jgi:hypothetical protein